MKALFKTVLATAFVLCISACEKPDSQVGILSFSVSKSLNSVLSYDINGVVDETSKTINLTIPSAAINAELIPTFTATEYDEVSISGKSLSSGVTPVVLANGAKVNVDDNVSELSTSYTLVVLNNDEMAELLSMEFKAADNELLNEDVVAEKIEQEMIVRVPEKAFMQELVMTVSAGLNDVIKVNGEAVESGSSIKVDCSFPIDIIVTDEIAKTSASYVVKVGKILGLKMTKLGEYIEDGCSNTDYPTMAISPVDGLPYIAYSRKRIDPKDSYAQASVVKWNGSSFEPVGALGFTGSGADKAANKPIMAFDKNGTPHVAIIDAKNNTAPAVLKFDSGNWTLLGDAVTDKKVSSSYEVELVFDPVNNTPYVFAQGNGTGKTDPIYRGMLVNSFSGSWQNSLMQGTPAVNGTDGVYARSRSVVIGNEVYTISAFSGKSLGGYYIFKLSDGGWQLLGSNFLGQQHITAVSIAKDMQDNLYAMAAVGGSGSYEVKLFSVDKTNGEMSEVGSSVTAIGDRTFAYQDFAISPVDGNVVTVYKNVASESTDIENNTPRFRFIDPETGDWTSPIKVSDEKVDSQIYVRYSKDGKCYACFLDGNTDSIVLYSIGYEDDILPE